ncbi:MAG TPA: EAL domain-containing protein [Gemmatimonadaceae bacterium]|nr:EAL domain-containing protein [Gemmatimonadaceae bacterium]
MTPSSFAAYLAEGLGAFVIAVVFQRLLFYYNKGYLLHWARSWSALCGNLVVLALGLALADAGIGARWVHLPLAFVVSVTGYLHLGWLVFGTYELTTRRALQPRTVRRLIVALSTVGVLTALLALVDVQVGSMRVAPRAGVHNVAAVLAYAAAAAAAWRTWRSTRGLGSVLVALAFGTHATVDLLRFLIVFALTPSEPLAQTFDALAWTDFVLRFSVGLGMIIWLLEEERRVARDAAAEIAYLAYHDTLTGLPNRQLVLDRIAKSIQRARREGHQLAVYFLDLDRFKVINDSLGHSVGDEVLKVVAHRVLGVLREEDTVGRLGGDEFVIVTPRVDEIDDAIVVARKVLDAVHPSMPVAGRELFVTPSMGISLYPGDGDDAETLLKNADSAMYRAKGHGGDTFRMYAPAMNARALEQLALESSLRRALANGEFDVFYQPISESATGRIVGMEAVLRWRHPSHGLLLPGDFIALAEATGVIVPLGEWVLRESADQVRRWGEAGHTGIFTSVNLSVRQLKQPNFVDTVARVITEVGIRPEALQLEITESMAMQSDDGGVAKLRDLRALGVRIAIDDFGTGFSSLAALRLLPLDALKIDRSFVQRLTTNADDAAIASAVIALANSLKLSVIAEGVERADQLAFLQERRCHMWQGYLFSKPVPGEEGTQLLEANRFALSAFPPRSAWTGIRTG